MSSKRAAVSVDTEARLVGEISNLEERRTALSQRRESAFEALAAAKLERSGILASDPKADLSETTRRVRDQEDEIETVDGVLVDLDETRGRLSGELEVERDRLARVASARVLEEIANGVDAAAHDAAQAIKALGDAARTMIAALPSSLRIVDFRMPGDGNRSNAERIVGAIVAEGLAAEFPEGFEALSFRHGFGVPDRISVMARAFDLKADPIPFADPRANNAPPPPVDVSSAASAAVSDRLRHRARDILSGDASADLADIPPSVPARKPLEIVSYPLITVQPFSFVSDDEGTIRYVDAVDDPHGVPKPVALAAIDRGLAFPRDSADALRIWEAETQRRFELSRHQMGGALPNEKPAIEGQCVHLGDPVGFLRHDEEAA